MAAGREKERLMFEQISDSYRKATESSLQTQQDMFKQWAQQWPSKQSRVAGPSQELSEECQKRWRVALTEALDSHRELLDFAYKSGIRTIEQTFAISKAKSPDELRRLCEELWRTLMGTVKTQSEGHMRVLQTASERLLDLWAKPAVPSAP
jgi:hypothetical protein